MVTGTAHADVSALRKYVAIARRRKLLILQALVVIPIGAFVLSLQQDPMHEASAEVMFAQQDYAASLNDLYTPWEDPARTVETQARLATSPYIFRRVIQQTGLTGVTANEFAGRTKVVTKQNANFLEFRVADPVAQKAVRLTNEYARQFTVYRDELDTQPIIRARKEIAERLRQLRTQEEQESPLYERLVEKDERLGTIQTLQTSSAYLVRPAETATQVRPRPVRTAIIATALAILIAAALALVAEALDTRVRSVEDIESVLGLPLLARLPVLRRQIRKAGDLATLVDPRGSYAEAVRMLRTNFDFVNLNRGTSVVMFTSALPEEGKTTAAANFAVTLARAGRRVTIVDLDFRRPSVASAFRCDEGPGVTDVALGYADLDDALAPISINPKDGVPRPARLSGGNGNAAVESVVQVLPAGLLPPNPGEFVTSASLVRVLRELRDRMDVVIVDAPPLLGIGDAMALTINVDAVIVVVHVERAKRGPLLEVSRALSASPTEALGFIAVGVPEHEDTYGYGAYYRPGRAAEPVGSSS